jgi:hypothetical protein
MYLFLTLQNTPIFYKSWCISQLGLGVCSFTLPLRKKLVIPLTQNISTLHPNLIFADPHIVHIPHLLHISCGCFKIIEINMFSSNVLLQAQHLCKIYTCTNILHSQLYKSDIVISSLTFIILIACTATKTHRHRELALGKTPKYYWTFSDFTFIFQWTIKCIIT